MCGFRRADEQKHQQPDKEHGSSRQSKSVEGRCGWHSEQAKREGRTRFATLILQETRQLPDRGASGDSSCGDIAEFDNISTSPVSQLRQTAMMSKEEHLRTHS